MTKASLLGRLFSLFFPYLHSSPGGESEISYYVGNPPGAGMKIWEKQREKPPQKGGFSHLCQTPTD